MDMDKQYKYWDPIIRQIPVLENEEIWACRVIDEYLHSSEQSVARVIVELPHEDNSTES